MDLKEFIPQAMRTNSFKRPADVMDEDGIAEPLVCDRENVSLFEVLHGAIGLATEAGELLDALKKVFFYHRKLDIYNIKEELGDLAWYFACVCDALDLDPHEILDINIAKLRRRYPDKFTKDRALNRDLVAEREILEQ